MKDQPKRPRTPPALDVEYDDETVDVRAFARTYVNILLTLEGIALVPAALKQAS
jgi:hypothetical protein